MVNIWQMYQSDILSGLKVTLIASITALIFSLMIGTLMAIFQVSRNKWIKRIGNGYVNLFRNLPLLIVVMFLFVVLPLYGIKMDGITAGTVGLTL